MRVFIGVSVWAFVLCFGEKKAKGQGNGKLARWDPLLFTKSKIYETKFVTYPRQRLPLKSILVRSLISLIW